MFMPTGLNDDLRLCVVINSIDIGGAETQLLRMCRLIATRIHVEVIYYGGTHVLLDQYRQTNARVTYFDKAALGKLRFIGRLARHVRNGRFDVVHCWLGTANVYGVLAGVLAGVGCIMTGQRSQDSPGALRTAFDRFVQPWTVGRMVNSHAIRRAYCRRTGFPERQVFVVHNGYDPSEFENQPAREVTRRRYGIPPDRPVVVTVGRLSPEKAQDTFVLAAGELARRGSNAHFAVVGDGPVRARLESAAAECGVRDRMHFLGACHDVPAILAASDASVCASPEEGLPNAVIESMLAGVPIISTDNGGGPEAIANAEQIVPAGDPVALAEKLAMVLTNPELARRWSELGRQRALREFAIEVAADRYLALLRERLAFSRSRLR